MRRFLVVTNDRYEFPIDDCLYVEDAAKVAGYSLSHVTKAVCGLREWSDKKPYKVVAYDDGRKGDKRRHGKKKRIHRENERESLYRSCKA